MCQGCVDDGSIAQATYDLIQAFLIEWPDAEWGPAHIVLSDSNLENVHLEYCIADINALLDGRLDDPALLNSASADTIAAWLEHDRSELIATRAFLGQLLSIPEAER